MKPRFAFSALLAAGALTFPAASQDLDVIPAYHPEGPGAGHLEVEMDTDLTVQFSLPGLDHASSLPFAATHLTLFVVGTSGLPTPISLGAHADLWLNPVGFLIIPVPSTLEVPINIGFDPLLVGGAVPTQVFDVDLLDPALELYSSDLISATLLEPVPDYADEMLPLASDSVGTDVVTYDSALNQYKFTHTATGGQVTEYLIDLNDPSVQKGSITVIETQTGIVPAIFGGFYYSQNGNSMTPTVFENFGTHTLLSHTLTGNTVRIDYQDDVPAASGVGTTTHTRAIEYTLVGKSLKVHGFQTDNGHDGDDGYSSFYLGNHAALNPAAQFEQVRVPYMDQIGINMVDKTTFVQSYIDLFQSNAQLHTEASFWAFANLASNTELMKYSTDTDGQCKNLDETGWLTVTDELSDCFVRTTYPRGPHADDFSNFVAVAFSRQVNNDPNTYTDDFHNIQRMQSWGMKDVLMWKTHWMHFGQNRRATTHTPADPTGGTDAEFATAISTAVNGGWRTALYTDFYSLDQAQGFDDNPNYSETAPVYINWDDAVVDGNGNYRLGYGIAEDLSIPHGVMYNTRLLSPKRSLKHFEREAAYMTSVYGVNANYFDVMTISAPDLIVTGKGQNQGVISGDAKSPNDGTIKGALNSYRRLFQGAANAVNGPVLGEGSFWLFNRRWDTFYMGFLDGAWRTISTGGPPGDPAYAGEDQPIIPDYEINVVRPVMPGLFGMGQYTRFLKVGTHPAPYTDLPIYELRATEISYGHNGYMMSLSQEHNGDDYLKWADQIEEYYAMRSFPDEWDAATGATVEYRDATIPGGWMNLTTAIKTGLDLTIPVVRTTYDNGLVVTVNHAPTNVTEAGKTLPKNGWHAFNPTTGYLNESVLDPVSGARFDHVVCTDYEMADGSGTSHDFGGAVGVTSDLKVVVFNPALTLTEQPNGDILVQ